MCVLYCIILSSTPSLCKTFLTSGLPPSTNTNAHTIPACFVPRCGIICQTGNLTLNVAIADTPHSRWIILHQFDIGRAMTSLSHSLDMLEDLVTPASGYVRLLQLKPAVILVLRAVVPDHSIVLSNLDTLSLKYLSFAISGSSQH